MIDRNQVRKQLRFRWICDVVSTVWCVVSLVLIRFAPEIYSSYYVLLVIFAMGVLQLYLAVKNEDLKVVCTCPHCHKRISPRRLLRENMVVCPYCGKPIVEQKPEIDL